MFTSHKISSELADLNQKFLDRLFCREISKPELVLIIRQNGAPSGLEKRGLDASIYHKTRKPTEGTQ
ncbi:hypothetical protein IQA64_17770 [Leptospira borgpetersenii serovar Tarassovi]|nr:hypothetical protein [Leptospira borgpetersenii serovar Tarassovi]